MFCLLFLSCLVVCLLVCFGLVFVCCFVLLLFRCCVVCLFAFCLVCFVVCLCNEVCQILASMSKQTNKQFKTINKSTMSFIIKSTARVHHICVDLFGVLCLFCLSCVPCNTLLATCVEESCCCCRHQCFGVLGCCFVELLFT